MRNAHTNSHHGQSGSSLTRALADAQELAADGKRGIPAVFRIYTEDVIGQDVSTALAANGFDGATLFTATGIYKGIVERGLVVEIVDTLDSRSRVLRLALSIAQSFKQTEVLVTWQSSKGFDTARVYGK